MDTTAKLIELINYATLAPSGHNTQPWRFSIEANTIRIFPDLTRRLPVVMRYSKTHQWGIMHPYIR